MIAPVSVRTMLKQLAGMVDTKDLSPWENDFLKQKLEATGNGDRTSVLTTGQIEKIEQIWRKHFAG
jgi:hypothetical protein